MSIFDASYTFLRGTSVTEKNKIIAIDGIRTHLFSLDLQNKWKTSAIAVHFFKKMRRLSLDLNAFFAPDFYYILQTLISDRRTRSNRNVLREIAAGMANNTWLKGALGDSWQSRLDYSALDRLSVTLLPHQMEFLKRYDECTVRWRLNGYILGASPGSGKALAKNTPVKVPNGWRDIGNLKVGDLVASRDGAYTPVTGVYPQGKKQLYKVLFSDGRSVDACAEHLWQYHSHSTAKSGYWKIGNTEKLIELLANPNHRLYIPLPEAVQDEEVFHEIDPYAIGIFIGNGTLTQTSVGWARPDQFVVDEMQKLLPEELEIRDCPDGMQKHICLKKEMRAEYGVNFWRMELERLDIFGKYSYQKYIPEEYMTGSAAQRQSLLQGLMDSDGYIDTQSTTSFTSTSKRLAYQVQELVRSLGGIAVVVPKSKTYSYKGELRLGHPAYQVNIRLKKPSDLFRLPRKKERANDAHQYCETLKLKIVSITPASVAEAVCISVAHPEKLFVVKDYIVTHNTIACISLAETLNSDVVICIVPKNAVERVWSDTLSWIFKSQQPYWTSTSSDPLTKSYKYYVAHYEQLDRIVEFFRTNHKGKRITIVLDESHNLNEIKSQRTNLFMELCKITNSTDVVWSSGTPIKAMGSEVIPILRTIDPFFGTEEEERFKKVFGLSTARALDILAHRLGYMSFKVSKSEVVGNTVLRYRIDVKVPDSRQFTLAYIKDEMALFVKERVHYYQTNMDKYIAMYKAGLTYYQDTLMTRPEKEAFAEYKRMADALHRGYDPFLHKQEPVLCNAYEKKYILPVLPKELRENFLNSRAVYKYMSLKVQGEALGRVLGKKRVLCSLEMLRAWKNYQVTDLQTSETYGTSLVEIVDNSTKKTVVFTSYVEVVDEAAKIFKDAGANPLKVYGETNRELPQIVGIFDKDQKANPLIATLQSLSTAVPLVMANTVVFLNSPFRIHEYEQACSRVDRLGQTETVHIFDVYLDTGEDANISTRSLDILSWSKEMVEAMLGTSGSSTIAVESYPEDINDMEAFHELHGETLVAWGEKPSSDDICKNKPALETFSW